MHAGLLGDVGAFAGGQPVNRPGASPKNTWTCPLSHPIKENFTTHSGKHVSGGGFYDETKP